QPTSWRATILTLFPEMFPGPLGVSLPGKALASGLWELEARDIRAVATDKHRSVDDTPAGGGPGMVLRADILAAAIDVASVGPDHPGSPHFRRPRQGRGLAAGGIGGFDPVPAAGSLGQGAAKAAKRHDKRVTSAA